MDRWTEQATDWTSPVTRTFYKTIYAPRHPQHGQTVTSRSSSTEAVGTSQKALEYLRQIDVAFEVTGFGPGEVLQSIIFDGIEVSAKEGTVTADSSGKLTGTFTIPADVPAGTKLVEFRGGEGGSTAQATFVGQGTLEVTTLRQVQTVTNTNIDPLAQTFMLDKAVQLAGVDVWFTARGDSGVRVQIRDVSNGVPTRTVLAEAVVPAASLVVTGGGIPVSGSTRRWRWRRPRNMRWSFSATTRTQRWP